MVRSTAEVLSSNLHPAVDSPENQRGVLRQSLVIFLRPDHQAQLRRWKGGVVDEEGIGQEGEEEGGVSRKQWLERGHLSRKIGVGCHKPGDFAKGAGTEDLRRQKLWLSMVTNTSKGAWTALIVFSSLFGAPGYMYQRGNLLFVARLWSFCPSVSISSRRPMKELGMKSLSDMPRIVFKHRFPLDVLFLRGLLAERFWL